MVQFKLPSAPNWQTIYIGSEGTAKVILAKKEKQYPIYQFRLKEIE
jgi:hypothetical protein